MADTEMQNSTSATKPDLGDEEIDASIDQEVNANVPLDPDATGALSVPDGVDANLDTEVDATAEAPAFEARISAKKDISLREFLPKMDEYAPI
ncbi:MAG: hypothetical protein Q9157_008346, partial [Trypethelium eluteriae]